jgi:hypothetical protein
MNTSRFGQFLLGVGGAVGVAAVIGIVVGFEPAKLPAALLNIAVYKLTFATGAGLLAAGAIVRRYAQRESKPHDDSSAPSIIADVPRQNELGEGGAPDQVRARSKEPARDANQGH